MENSYEKLNSQSKIKHVIGIVSGKGGVGKSFVAAMLAVRMNRLGYQVGILDGDITGPSIPKMFGITQKAVGTKSGILPKTTKNNIKIMSVNLLLDNQDDPVLWRGPIMANAIKQFYGDVIWGELDYLFIDLPPGTGDVPLTVFQSIPLDGIVIVSSPQDLVAMIVKKAYNMAKKMNIPVLGLVENMSYVVCPDCHREIAIFGTSQIEQIAQDYQVPLLEKIPLDPDMASLVDQGRFEEFGGAYLEKGALKIVDDLAAKEAAVK